MTKYVLNSGGINNGPDKGAAFFHEIVKGLGPQPKILMCFFAEPQGQWEAKYATYCQGFQQALDDSVRPIFELALPDQFATQVQSNSVLYMHGGNNHRIKSWLKKYPLPDVWEGKVVATNSASSHALARHSWTCDERRCSDGLGILPIKFLAHFKSTYGHDDPRGPIDWDKAKQELSEYSDTSLPVYALKEGDYVVIKQ